MLDLKSTIILKILQKECHGSGYKVIDKSDIISAMPAKYRVDEENLDHIITYLERSECIHVKYDDENVYCLCVLPMGNQITEKEEKNKKEKAKILAFANFYRYFFNDRWSFRFNYCKIYKNLIGPKFSKICFVLHTVNAVNTNNYMIG